MYKKKRNYHRVSFTLRRPSPVLGFRRFRAFASFGPRFGCFKSFALAREMLPFASFGCSSLAHTCRQLELAALARVKAAVGSIWPLEPGPEAQNIQKVPIASALELQNIQSVLLESAPESQNARHPCSLGAARATPQARKAPLEPRAKSCVPCLRWK